MAAGDFALGWRVSLPVAAWMLVGACGDGATGPSGPAARVVVSAGNEQIGSAGQWLPAPVAAKVTDAAGRGVPSVAVQFVVLAGEGEITPSSARTNGAGLVTATWRVGRVAGEDQLAVAQIIDSLSGALVDTALFTASVLPGPPAAMSAIGGDGQTGVLGQTLPQQLRVLLRDAYGNAVPGITVTWSVVSGSGTLASPTSTTDSAGLAKNTLTLGQSEDTVSVRVSVGALRPVTFSAHARRFARLATLPGPGFGIARTPAGDLVVSLIHQGALSRVPMSGANSQQSIPVGGTPTVVATDAAGAYAYVANMDGTLGVVDLGTNTEVADISIPGYAHSLAMGPRGDRVYVTNTDHSVFAVDIATRTIVGTSLVGTGPWGLAFTTTGGDSLMYVSCRDGGSVAEIDLRDGAVRRTITVSGRPHGLVIAPAGGTLYLADDTGGEVQFVDLAGGTIAARVPLPGAFGIAITADGSSLYVTTNDGFIAVIDVATRAITRRYQTGGQPRQILALEGGTAMAANLGGWIDVVTR